MSGYAAFSWTGREPKGLPRSTLLGNLHPSPMTTGSRLGDRPPGPNRRLLLITGAVVILVLVAIYALYVVAPADPADAEREAGLDVNAYEGDAP